MSSRRLLCNSFAMIGLAQLAWFPPATIVVATWEGLLRLPGRKDGTKFAPALEALDVKLQLAHIEVFVHTTQKGHHADKVLGMIPLGLRWLCNPGHSTHIVNLNSAKRKPTGGIVSVKKGRLPSNLWRNFIQNAED